MKKYGKYRGTVVNNVDPMGLGRIQVSASDPLGEGERSWAMPNVPYAGDGVGLFLIPPRGANVWVEFEGGDLDYPIWSGCFWAPGEVPDPLAAPTTKVFKSDSVTVTIDDSPGSGRLAIELGSQTKIELSSSGIEIKHSGKSVKLSSANVSVNDGALEVT